MKQDIHVKVLSDRIGYNAKQAGLNEKILSKIVFENDEAKSSICGVVYLSKKRILLIQAKVWNDKPYFDFRVWFKDEDAYYPTKKGFMIAQQHTESKDSKGNKHTIYPLNDFFTALDAIRTFPDENTQADDNDTI